MICKTKTFVNVGLDGFEVLVEADTSRALPNIDIIGLPDAAIKESKERIKATFRNVDIKLPNKKFILNLAPSDIKKVGSSFDLPMAVAILQILNEENICNVDKIQSNLFFGELGLDGKVKRINGVLTSVISAIKKGYKNFFVPQENLYELEYIPNINIYPISHFQQIIDFFVLGKDIKCVTESKNLDVISKSSFDSGVDFCYIKGHMVAKRALSIAAAGGHNLLMVGAPGSGKTMLSKALHTVLPPLSFDEVLEISQIYSVLGKLNKDNPLIIKRPFRQIHHTASKISIVGGGTNLIPGEVSMAHKGILFFDELTEFPRETLEVLRQPLEDKNISISRVSGSVNYPANFMFVASMNPCKCGYYKDLEKNCKCSIGEIKRYQDKISGPLMDRIDMVLEIPRENIDKLLDNIKSESSQSIQQRVLKAWKFQKNRFKGTDISCNSDMNSRDIEKYIKLTKDAKDFLSNASDKLTLSPRVVHRIIKLARTIADMDQNENLEIKYLAEAMQYRSKSMFVDN